MNILNINVPTELDLFELQEKWNGDINNYPTDIVGGNVIYSVVTVEDVQAMSEKNRTIVLKSMSKLSTPIVSVKLMYRQNNG